MRGRTSICKMGVAAVAAIALAPAAASADIVVPTVADTYLTNDERAAPDANQGDRTAFFEVRWYDDGAGTTRIRLGYLRFDISGVDPTLFPTATLTGEFDDSRTNGAGTWNVYGLKNSLNADNWDESTTNYSNAVGVNNSSPMGTFELDMNAIDFLGTVTLTGDDTAPLLWSSNATDLYLGDFLAEDTDGLVTFIITDSTSSGTEWRIAARTNTDGHQAPSLVFVPEPASLALLGVAGGCLLARRRR